MRLNVLPELRSVLIKRFRLFWKVTIIDDCYNANPVSMKASIDVLSNAPGRKIAVLGDMGELGAEEKQLHYMVGEHFAGKGIDALYCVGTLSQEITKAVRALSPAAFTAFVISVFKSAFLLLYCA